MNKLHDIFIDHYGEKLLAGNALDMEQEIKKLMLELIGPNSTPDPYDPDFLSPGDLEDILLTGENNAKDELRKEIEKL